MDPGSGAFVNPGSGPWIIRILILGERGVPQPTWVKDDVPCRYHAGTMQVPRRPYQALPGPTRPYQVLPGSGPTWVKDDVPCRYSGQHRMLRSSLDAGGGGGEYVG